MRIALVYATKHGYTAAVAHRIATECASEGAACDVIDLRKLPPSFSLDQYDGIIVAGSIYLARHARKLEAFVRAHRLSALPSALISVSASAISKQTLPDVEKVDEKFLAATGWKADRHLCVAGELAYTRYNVLVRWIIRRIAAKNGGDTDTTRDHAYTNWPELREFVRDFINFVQLMNGEALAHALA